MAMEALALVPYKVVSFITVEVDGVATAHLITLA